MEKEVSVTYEKSEGVATVQFTVQNPLPCCLSFSSAGRVVLEVPGNVQDSMRQFGFDLLFADELKMDLTQLEVNVRPASLDKPEAFDQVMLNTVRRLCLSANLYFKDRAAFYWGIFSSQCRVANMHVLSHRYKIAYKQLIEIDSVLFNNMQP